MDGGGTILHLDSHADMGVPRAWPEGAAGREWHLFPIEDPVDEDHDLGRVLTPRSLAVLKQELSRAAQTLAEGGTLEQVLREHQ